MTCTTCQSPIPPTVFAMFGPKCDACRHPPLAGGAALIARAKWIAIVRRVEQTAYPYEGWETAAPPLDGSPYGREGENGTEGR